jgi:hypothetical protein
MIQPTMFFYLKNIPMFRGTYIILDVTHSISGNNIVTTFTGSRVPKQSLPDPNDSFTASYRVLFDKISNKAIAKFKQMSESSPTTEKTVIFRDGSYVIDMGDKQIIGEKLINDVGVTEFGIPYNGFNDVKEIQKVTYLNEEWYRAIAVKIGGKNYQLDKDITMKIANGIKYSELSGTNYNYYNLKFQINKTITEEKIRTGITEFLNPNTGRDYGKRITINPRYQLDPNNGTIVAEGPVGIGPNVEGYGIGMSPQLMSSLGLFDGQVVYFRIK